MSAEQSKLSFEPSPRLTCVSRAGSPSLLSARSPASPAGPLRGSRQGAFKDAPPLLSRSFGWARKGARIGVISLLAAAAVLSSCIGGNALQGTPVQDPSVVTFLSNFTARDQWWEAPRRPKAEDLAGLDPEKVYFETCLLQKLGESWTIWDTRDLRSHQSAVRLAVFRTSTTTTTTTTTTVLLLRLLLLLLLLRQLLLLLLLLLRRRRRRRRRRLLLLLHKTILLYDYMTLLLLLY